MSAQSRHVAQLPAFLTGLYQNRFLPEECTLVARMVEQNMVVYVKKEVGTFGEKMEQPEDQLGQGSPT